MNDQERLARLEELLRLRKLIESELPRHEWETDPEWNRVALEIVNLKSRPQRQTGRKGGRR